MTIYAERTSNDVETVLEAAPLAPMWHPGSPKAVRSGMPLMDDLELPDLLIGAITDESLAPPLVPAGYRDSAGRVSSSPVGDHHHEADLQSPTLVHDLLATRWLAWRTYPRIGLVGGMALGVSAAAALSFVVVKNFPVQRAAGALRVASAANATPGTVEAGVASSPAGAVGTGWSRPASPPQLIAVASGGRGGDEPLPLGLALSGEPAGAVLMINGLPQGAALSRGKRASATAWRLDPGSDLGDVAVRPPPRFSGPMTLTAELVLNGETVDRRSVRLEWSGARTAQAPAGTSAAPLPQAAAGRPVPAPPGPSPTTATAKPQRPATAAAASEVTGNPASPPTGGVEPRDKDVDALIARGQRLMRAKDIASARVVLQRAADRGDPRAALSLGETYDPVMLERLGVRGGVGDIGQARAWYERAQGLGSTEAPRRLKLLAAR